MTTFSAVALLPVKSSRSTSPTALLCVVAGSTRSSGVPNWTCRNGSATSISTASTGIARSAGRRMACPASRPQNGAAVDGSRLRAHGSRPEFTRRPSTASSAGSTTTAAAIEMSTTPIPA